MESTASKTRRNETTASTDEGAPPTADATTPDDDVDDDEVALSDIRRRLEEITESLGNARKREEDARLENNLLRGRRDGTKVQTEDVVARLKRGLS